MKPNLLDRLVTFVAPDAGVRRMRARAAAEVVVRHYEAADHGRRTQNWRAPQTSAASSMRGLDRLRARGRALRRNNGWASNAIAVLDTRIVGTGIVATPPKGRTADLWRGWSETLECSHDGLLNFGGIQSLAVQQMAEAGEVLIVRRWRRGRAGGEVPLRIEVLEPEHLDTSRDTLGNDGSVIRQGVEYGPDGRRRAYWLFPHHPYSIDGVWEPSRRVEARDVIHLFRVERAGQVRGVPWGSPCLLSLRDFDEFQDAALLQKKVAACFAAFVTEDGDYDADNPTGKDADEFDTEQLEPASVRYLRPGESVTFGTPPSSPDYPDFSRISLMGIAAGFQLPYEALTGDLSRVNFSSGRMGALEFFAKVERWRWLTVIPRACDPLYQWFLEAAEFAGQQVDRAPVRWTAPRREFIDPGKEVRAIAEQVAAGLISLSEAQRELGFDPDELLEELANDVQKLREKNLPVSVLARAGAAKPAEPDEEEGEDDDEEAGGDDGAKKRKNVASARRNGFARHA